MTLPVLSVCMVTYRHADFIEQAIQSVISQITTFPIELVIGDDASPDSTAQKVRRFESTSQARIHLRVNPRNLGAAKNFAMTLADCKGTYIALLEGDDYWTNPLKLQRQVDFLAAHPEFSICYHPVDVLRNGKLEPDTFTRNVPEVCDIRELAKGNFMHTCSVVFKHRLFDRFPDNYFESPVGDYFLHMLNAQFGPVKRLAEKMAVYRVHGGGTYSSGAGIDMKVLKYLELMIGCFSAEINELLKQRHQKIAYQSFVARMAEPGISDRWLRCIKYGENHIQSQLGALLEWDKTTQHSLLLRKLRELFRLRHIRRASRDPSKGY